MWKKIYNAHNKEEGPAFSHSKTGRYASVYALPAEYNKRWIAMAERGEWNSNHHEYFNTRNEALRHLRAYMKKHPDG